MDRGQQSTKLRALHGLTAGNNSVRSQHYVLRASLAVHKSSAMMEMFRSVLIPLQRRYRPPVNIECP